MRNEMPELSFKELLMVPEGPPESVWERALDAAFAAPDDAAPDDPEPAETDAPDADVLASAGSDDGPDTPIPHHDSEVAPSWDEGLGSDTNDLSHGDANPYAGDQLPYGDHAGDGLPGSGDDAGY